VVKVANDESTKANARERLRTAMGKLHGLAFVQHDSSAVDSAMSEVDEAESLAKTAGVPREEIDGIIRGE